jgi:hypothetical protein
MSPSHSELYCKGLIEVPACGPCGASDPCSCNAPGLGCQNGGCQNGGMYGGAAMATDGGMMPVPADGYDHQLQGEGVEPMMSPESGGVPQEPRLAPQQGQGDLPDPAASLQRPNWRGAARPARQTNPYKPAAAPIPASRATSTPGLIGPIGYDVQK